MTDLPVIPPSLLPADGRFGAGPSRVRAEQVAALVRGATTVLGTSHRQAPVKELVARVQDRMARFLRLPEGYEMVVGMGGASAFWDSAAFGLVQSRAQHLVFGEFGAKFAGVTDRAPFLESSVVLEAPAGSRPELSRPQEGVDICAWPQNETSTGVAMPVLRAQAEGCLTVVDATSAAGGMAVELSETDVYYFSPQKNFGSDGGLWFAAFSPAALERVERIAASGRWIPDVLSISSAVTNSRQHQTYNTPALAGLLLLDEQLGWLLEQGGMDWAARRTAETSGLVYDWANRSDVARPFVSDPAHRSPVVCTVDLDDAVDAGRVAAVLRANGVVDVEPYRKLGRNQLRIATFVSVPPEDVRALLECLDWTVAAIS